MTRRIGKIVLGLMLAGCAVPTPAHATCGADAARSPSAAKASDIERRFADLMVRDRFNDSAGQAERWRAFLRDARASHAPAPMLAQAMTSLAWSLEYSDQVDKATVAGHEALRFIAAHGLSGSAIESEALTVMATIQADTGDTDAGAASAAKALEIAEKLFGPRSAEASLAHNAVGTVAYAQGRYVQAEREYGLAADLAAECLPAGDPLIVNQMASHAGTLYMNGDTEAALVEAQRAANWAMTHLPEENPVITLALGNLGALLGVTGRYVEAEAALHKVVDLEGTYQKENWTYRAISLSNYAHMVDTLGRHEEAEALWLASVKFHEKSTIKRDPSSSSFPIRFAADAAQARGDLELALQRRNEAVRLVDAATPADNPERARTHLELAMTTLLLGQPERALAIAGGSVEIIRAGYGEEDSRRMQSEIGYAQILARNGRLEEAYQLGSAVAERLEKSLLDTASSRGDLVRHGPTYATSFAAMTALALETGRTEQAFRYLQLANLSDIVLVTNEVAARAAASDPETSARIREFQDSLRQRQSLDRERSFALGAGNAEQATRLATRIADNDAKIARLGAEVDRIAPRFRDVARPSPVPLDVFRARLAKSEALLAPVVLPDAVLSVVVTQEGLYWQRTPLLRPELQELVRTVRASADGSAVDLNEADGARFDYIAARKLYRLLLPDALASRVAHHRDLVYFASGELASLPPGLLISQDGALAAPTIDPRKVRWLLRDHSVRVASSLLPPPMMRGARDGARFLGVGAPALGTARAASDRVDLSGLPPLPGTKDELERIATVLGKGKSTLLTGTEASEAALGKLDLSQYGIVVFATHGLVGREHAGLDEPALVLSSLQDAAGQGEDGLLTASEVMQMRLDADWVILSACDTASGEGVGAPTFGGLAAAFTHAGARSLMVSHWPVRDDIAARIVVEAIRGEHRGSGRRQGLHAARALQRAQLKIIDSLDIAGSADPALWAPMVLVGQ